MSVEVSNTAERQTVAVQMTLIAAMAIWVAVVEIGDAPSDEVQLISRSEAIDDHGRRGGSD